MVRHQFPPSIRTVGLGKFLDKNKHKHNDMGYTQFCIFLEAKMNITNIARAFNVNRMTALNWFEIYLEERTKNIANDKTLQIG